MQAFNKLTAVAAPLDMANIDTDKIIPARFLRKARGPGYERLAFHDARFDADGNELQNGMLPVILPDATCQKLRQQLRDNPGAPITVDLESQTVTGPDGAAYRFDIDPTHRERLLKGLDDIGLVMQNIKEIEAFEKRHHDEMPWLA